jgi:ABC-type nitrate/sulfonate/bicarbonate transport system substrate-binding protein
VLTRAIGVFVTIGLLASVSSATAELLKVSVPQRGQWDTAVTELGTRGGVFKKYGLDIEVLYTQGGPESHQAVISGSMDVACGGGIESVIGAYSRGAPLRIIGSEMIGSPDTYWYVPSNSPIKSLADAAGKTISYSQNGSSSHTALLKRRQANPALHRYGAENDNRGRSTIPGWNPPTLLTRQAERRRLAIKKAAHVPRGFP